MSLILHLFAIASFSVFGSSFISISSTYLDCLPFLPHLRSSFILYFFPLHHFNFRLHFLSKVTRNSQRKLVTSVFLPQGKIQIKCDILLQIFFRCEIRRRSLPRDWFATQLTIEQHVLDTNAEKQLS